MKQPRRVDHRRIDRHRPRHCRGLCQGRRKHRRIWDAAKRKARHWKLKLRSLGAEAAFIRADVRHDDEVRNLVDQDCCTLRPH